MKIPTGLAKKMTIFRSLALIKSHHAMTTTENESMCTMNLTKKRSRAILKGMVRTGIFRAATTSTISSSSRMLTHMIQTTKMRCIQTQRSLLKRFIPQSLTTIYNQVVHPREISSCTNKHSLE